MRRRIKEHLEMATKKIIRRDFTFSICAVIVVATGLIALFKLARKWGSRNETKAVVYFVVFSLLCIVISIIATYVFSLLIKKQNLIAKKADEEKEKKRKFEDTKRKREFFHERELVNVTPKSDLSDIWAAIINELETNAEIFFQAELVDDDIRIHIEMKNGKIYSNVLHSTEFQWFEENFELLED